MDKSWYTSKTMWVSIAGSIAAVMIALGYEVSSEQMLAVILLIMSLLGITLRDAI